MSEQKERSQIYAAAYVFLIRDNKIFLQRRANTDWKNGYFNLPAGHIEAGESASIAAIREAREEAGVDINPEDLKIAHTMHRLSDSGRTYADYFFVAEKWSGEPHLAQPEVADKAEWFDLDALPEKIVYYLPVAINNYRNGIAYSEDGWDNAK